jgi:hypothetical protein
MDIVLLLMNCSNIKGLETREGDTLVQNVTVNGDSQDDYPWLVIEDVDETELGKIPTV